METALLSIATLILGLVLNELLTFFREFRSKRKLLKQTLFRLISLYDRVKQSNEGDVKADPLPELSPLLEGMAEKMTAAGFPVSHEVLTKSAQNSFSEFRVNQRASIANNLDSVAAAFDQIIAQLGEQDPFLAARLQTIKPSFLVLSDGPKMFGDLMGSLMRGVIKAAFPAGAKSIESLSNADLHKKLNIAQHEMPIHDMFHKSSEIALKNAILLIAGEIGFAAKRKAKKHVDPGAKTGA